MEARKKENSELWQHRPDWRDNGVITTGTYFRMIVPEFVENYLNGDIPMIVSKQSSVIMKQPDVTPKVAIQNVEGNQTKDFVANNAKLFL